MSVEANTLAAHLTLGLHPGLSASDKRVGAAIIEHFNRRTGQCDPSIGRLANLLGLPERTVKRSTARLHELSLILKSSHGGKSNRASYAPNWERFIAFKEAWEGQLRGETGGEKGTKLSPRRGQNCPVNGDKNVTQTHRRNPEKKPTGIEPAETGTVPKPPARTRLQPSKPRQGHMLLPLDGGLSKPGTVAANARAERTIHSFLSAEKGRYDLYALSVSDDFHRSVVSAEVREKGAGLDKVRRYLADQSSAPPKQAMG